VDHSRILLKLILGELGMDKPQLDSFTDRLCVQKYVYLTQVVGLGLGYRYNWYLRGPYSPALTQDAFALPEEIQSGEDDFEDYELTDEARSNMECVKALAKLPKDIDVAVPAWLEVLASIHYLQNIAYWPVKSPTKEEVISKLIEAKPQFVDRPEVIEAAWARLSELQFRERKSPS
jgi:uncharacterized protein YwgA